MAPNAAPSYALSDATSDDLGDYDVISEPGPRSLDSSIADLDQATFGLSLGLAPPPREPPPSREAVATFDTAGLSAEEVQAYVRRATERSGASAAFSSSSSANATGTVKRASSRDAAGRERMVRVYVDGIFDILHSGAALQLRQAKLAFPNVHLLVGVFSDEQLRAHASVPSALPHIERAELVRHLRWVDEVLPDAPFVLDEAFLARNRIDYVAIEEGSSVDPAVDRARLAGYDLAKSIGKAIPTRRTRNIVAQTLVLTPPNLPEAPRAPKTPEPQRADPPAATPKSPPVEVDESVPPEPNQVFGLGI